ncbi:transposase [Pseudobacillus wudalianchiensis]|nr:transposase [Bacillus wudalianchiensis]
MSKYTVEVKLQAVEHYLTENESYQNIAESIGAASKIRFSLLPLSKF